MKSIFILIVFLFSTFGYTQDTTFRYSGGTIEVKRLRFGKIHSVKVITSIDFMDPTLVKRVDFEYMFKRTYHGSTQPANPEQFYKPIKRKSFYYVPVADVEIRYTGNNEVFQTFSKDSLILRTYRQDGTREEIIYFNQNLQADSILRFYENDKLLTKIIGGANQPLENLQFSYTYRPKLLLRKRPFEWNPDYRFRLPMTNWGPTSVSKKPCYLKKQYHCHGNGSPHLIITWLEDSIGASTYHQEYEFFDPEGNKLDSNKMTFRPNQWIGVQYKYYKTGVLQSKGEYYGGRLAGKNENWNRDGTRKSIEYWNKRSRDSIVFFKQLKDTLFSWRPPMHFEWNSRDTFIEVKHRQFNLSFNHKGEVRGNRDTILYSGAKDELGLPHGRWLAVGESGDTLFDVTYKNGWLHGPFRYNSEHWPNNWTRNYHMGLESDSSVRWYKGTPHDIHYFSEPGKLAKKTLYMFGDGSVSSIDTTLNGRRFIHLLKMHSDGYILEKSVFDTTTKTIYKQEFYTADALIKESWTDYFGRPKEWKSYHLSTGELHKHWKDEGMKKVLVPSENSEGVEQDVLLRTYKSVKMATQRVYDETGVLIRKEILEDGAVVD